MNRQSDPPEPRAPRPVNERMRGHYDAIVESSSDAIIGKSLDGIVTSWNAAAEQVFGYTAAEAIGRSILFLFPDDRLDEERGILTRVGRGESVAAFETTRRRKDGTLIEVSIAISPIRDQDGRVIGVSKIARDITSRRREEAARLASDARFRAIFDYGGIGMAIHDVATLQVLQCNFALAQMLGFTPDEVCGRTIEELVHPEDRAATRALIDDLLRHRRPNRRLEQRYARRDGSFAWANLTLTLAPDPTGSGELLLAMVEDTSARKRLEEQLLRFQKMETVGRLAGGVAHDFNNLLTVILGEAELALANLPESGEVSQAFQEIQRAGRRAASLTRQLLIFARQEVQTPILFDVNVLVTDIAKMLHRLIGEDITLTMHTTSEPALVRMDRGQLEQVLVNLAVNARDAMPEGGHLTIEIREFTVAESDLPFQAAGSPGPRVQLSVTDTGSGMSEDVRSHAFEPFFTTKPPGRGSGLGLATCYGIIRAAGGEISIYSEAGLGTTVRVTLPRAATQESPEPSREEIASPGGGETILLVEDEDAVRSVAARILEECGYRVLQASSGEEALTLLVEAQPAIDLLLTDVVMTGMNGRVLAERARESFPGLRVLFATGYSGDVIHQQRLLQEGARIMQKPFTRNELARRVREALDGRAG